MRLQVSLGRRSLLEALALGKYEGAMVTLAHLHTSEHSVRVAALERQPKIHAMLATALVSPPTAPTADVIFNSRSLYCRKA